MNKKVIVFAMLAALAATPALAEKGDFWFGLNLGLSAPTGDFGDFADMGYQGTLTGTYMLSPAFGMGADLGYHSWSGTDDFNESFADPSTEASFSAIQATAHGKFMIPMEGKARPYLQGGLGIYNFKFEIESDTFESDVSESDFGYNLGGGLNFLVSPMYMIGVGAAYHSIQSEGESTDLFTVGVNLLWGMGGQ